MSRRAVLTLGLALACALNLPVSAFAAPGDPSCAPEKTLAVSFEAHEGEGAVPLVATHEVTLKAEWPEAVRNPTLSVADGVPLLAKRPRQLRLIAPAGASLAVTASWQQATDPSDPASDPSDPAARCVASQTIALPITAAKPPRDYYDLEGRRADISSLAVVPDRKAGDLSPLQVTVRVTNAARFPSPRRKPRSMPVAMRPSERVHYRTHIPSPAILISPRWCRLYSLTCGEARISATVNTLWGGRYRNGRVVKRTLDSRDPLPPTQPYRAVAPNGVRINVGSFSLRPGVPEPRVYEYPTGYDIQVHQSGRLVARLRRVVRCGLTPGQRYYCHLVRAKNG